MRIGILYNYVENMSSGRQGHLVSVNEGAKIAQEIETLVGDRHDVVPVLATLDVGKRLKQGQFDLVFNVCEGFGQDARGEAWIAGQLEMANVPFTGSDSLTLALCQDKARTKALMLSAEIPTPPFQVLNAPSEPVRSGLAWPLIVKPVLEDASEGITQDSVVSGPRELGRMVERLLATYGQPVLVEEYIDGRELNVAFLGSGTSVQPLPVSEILFDAVPGLHRIVDFDSKWVPGSLSSERSSRALCPAELSSGDQASVARVARSACVLMGCRDYARVDIRFRDGVPYVLEVNPNPCLSEEGGFFRSARATGLTYDGMIWAIMRGAMARYGVVEKPAGDPPLRGVSGVLMGRAVKPSDISCLLKWFNDDEVSRMMDDPHLRHTRESLMDAFFLRENAECDLFFVHRGEGLPVGFASIYNINRTAGSGEISFLVGDRELRGTGLARHMVSILIGHAFETLGMQRLEATVLPENIPSLKVLESLGFRRVGTFRKRFSNGKTRSDEIVLEKLKDFSG